MVPAVCLAQAALVNSNPNHLLSGLLLFRLPPPLVASDRARCSTRGKNSFSCSSRDGGRRVGIIARSRVLRCCVLRTRKTVRSSATTVGFGFMFFEAGLWNRSHDGH
jgi:hypothetical protein